MSNEDYSYGQPEKQLVRAKVLSHAVDVLTVDRQSGAILQKEELLSIIDYALGQLPTSVKTDGFIDELERWLDFFSSTVGTKKPEELKVLYLSGPEPLNDLF